MDSRNSLSPKWFHWITIAWSIFGIFTILVVSLGSGWTGLVFVLVLGVGSIKVASVFYGVTAIYFLARGYKPKHLVPGMAVLILNFNGTFVSFSSVPFLLAFYVMLGTYSIVVLLHRMNLLDDPLRLSQPCKAISISLLLFLVVQPYAIYFGAPTTGNQSPENIATLINQPGTSLEQLLDICEMRKVNWYDPFPLCQGATILALNSMLFLFIGWTVGLGMKRINRPV